MAKHVLELGVFVDWKKDRVATNDAGGGKTGDGTQFRMWVDQATGEPLIHCEKTKKTFRLRWQDIVEIAINQGVTTPDGQRH